MTSTTTEQPGAWRGAHGHVTPRADGRKAKCLGPGSCRVCSKEYAAAMDALRQASDEARANATVTTDAGRVGDDTGAGTILSRIPADALAQAEALGPLSPEERRGDITGERREMLRHARARFWSGVLRTWPDDDFTRAGLDMLDAGQQPSRIIAWMQDPDAKILILTGATGRGKTFTQFAIGNAYAGSGHYVYALSHKRYLDSLEPDGSDEPDWLIRRRAANAEVLLVDGFGDEMDPTRSASEFRLRETADLISARLGVGKRTVISTNLKSQQLTIMFGDRIISRLRKGSTALLIQGEDRRTVGATW